jgi:hypothetical protein
VGWVAFFFLAAALVWGLVAIAGSGLVFQFG